jgi:RNA polymerase sigma factor (sigma-70 family)
LSKESESVSDSLSDLDVIRKQQLLALAIERFWQDLLGDIRLFVWKFGIAQDRSTVEMLAEGILHDTVIVALQKAEKYDPDRLPRPWLRGIAFNQVRRLRRKQAYEYGHIELAADTSQVRETIQRTGSDLPEGEMIDLLYYHGQYLGTAGQTTLKDLLSLVSDSDQEVLGLAFEGNLKGKSLAAALGISEGAAWARLSRAIKRLRIAYAQSERELGEE